MATKTATDSAGAVAKMAKGIRPAVGWRAVGEDATTTNSRSHQTGPSGSMTTSTANQRSDPLVAINPTMAGTQSKIVVAVTTPAEASQRRQPRGVASQPRKRPRPVEVAT